MSDERTIIDRRVEATPVSTEPVAQAPPPAGQNRTVWLASCGLLLVLCLGAIVCAGAGAFVFQAYVGTATARAALVPTLAAATEAPPTVPTATSVVIAGATPTPPALAGGGLPTILPAAQGTPDPSSRYADLLSLTSDWDGGPTSPALRTYHASADRGLPILVSLGWCTTTQQILDENWAKMKYSLTIDGSPVDLQRQFALRSFTDSVNIGPCYTYDGYTLGWSPGEHRLVWTQTIFEDLNDGLSDYAAGDYVMEWVLTVR